MNNIFKLATLIIKIDEEFFKTIHKKGFTQAFGVVKPRAHALSKRLLSPANSQVSNHDTG